MAEIVNCDFCGRNTPNKSRICKECNRGSNRHNMDDSQLAYAAACLVGLDVTDPIVDDMVRIAMTDMVE